MFSGCMMIPTYIDFNLKENCVLIKKNFMTITINFDEETQNPITSYIQPLGEEDPIEIKKNT